MSKLPFNFKDFVKVDANRDHTVMRSPEGHIIHVSHKALQKDLREALRQLPIQKLAQGGVVKKPTPQIPGSDKDKKAISDGFKNALGFKKMAEGGEVGEDGEDVSTMEWLGKKAGEGLGSLGEMAVEGAKDFTTPMMDFVSGLSGGKPAPAKPVDLTPAVPLAAQPMATVPEMQQPVPTTLTTPQGEFNGDVLGKGLANEAQGLLGQAEAEKAQAQSTERALGQTISQLQKLEVQRQERVKAIEQYNDKFLAAEGQEDPRKYSASMGTWGKIASAVGIMLGGGAVVGFIQRQIDRDVDAQRHAKDDRMNLYKLNLQRLGDEQEAVNMTRLNFMSIAELQIKQAVARGVSQAALPKLQEQLGKLQVDKAELIQKMEMNSAIKQQLSQQPQGSAPSPEAAGALVRTLVPAAQQPEAFKEIEFIKGLNVAMKDAKKAYATALGAGAFGAVLGKATPGGTDSSRIVQQANATIESLVRSNRPPGAGPFTDSDAAAQIQPFLLTVGDLMNPEAIQAKANGLEASLMRGYSRTGTLGSYGIKLAPPVSTSFTSTGRKVGK